MVAYQLAPRFLDMLREVNAGFPVIVLMDFGVWPVSIWHYAVVVGYDMQTSDVILRSGEKSRLLMPYGVLEYIWKESNYWAIVTAPPGRSRSTATEPLYSESGRRAGTTGQEEGGARSLCGDAGPLAGEPRRRHRARQRRLRAGRPEAGRIGAAPHGREASGPGRGLQQPGANPIRPGTRRRGPAAGRARGRAWRSACGRRARNAGRHFAPPQGAREFRCASANRAPSPCLPVSASRRSRLASITSRRSCSRCSGLRRPGSALRCSCQRCARFLARHLAAAHLLAQPLALVPAHAPLRRRHRPLRRPDVRRGPGWPCWASAGRQRGKHEQQSDQDSHGFGEWYVAPARHGRPLPAAICNNSCPPPSEVTRCFTVYSTQRYPAVAWLS